MRIKIRRKGYLFLFLFLNGMTLLGQQSRTQYPPGLMNAHFGVNIGYINYPFSRAQLEPGFTVESIGVPHPAVRILLYGLPINEYLSARVTYMRPVNWVEYRNVNGDTYKHTVWMNIAGLTLNAQVPLGKRFSVSGEAGLGIITRNGFEYNNIPVVTNASYATGLFGGGIQYHLSPKWALQLSSAWSPENKKHNQPQTLFVGAGFNYTLRALPEAKLLRNAKAGYVFPRHFLFAGYTTNEMGYGVNNFVSKGAIPVFWGGDVHVRRGFSFSYQRNIFHARKVFAMDWAAHLGLWQTRDERQQFFTASLNPVFRFNAIRTKAADVFFEYSVAGPTYISKTQMDKVRTGKKFTFHDFMGLGVFAGRQRSVYAGLRIAHYSNGNLFPENDGVMIPLTLNLGYVLK